MATKFSLESKFVAAGSKLKVYAHEGKQGVNLGVTIKNPGMKAATGCQSTFAMEDVEKAKARFEELVRDAQSLGWTPRSSTNGVATRRASFSEVPPAPVAAEVEKTVGTDPVDPDGFVIGADEPVGAEISTASDNSEPIVHAKGGRRRR
jgi:hypothetical protein